MLCTVLRAQLGDVRPLPYTASPLKLLWSDICLFFQSAWALPRVFLPLNLGRAWPLDEFYPSWRDFGDATIHAFLVVYQLLFLLSLPIVIIFLIPTLWVLAYIAAALLLNYAICKTTLSGFKRFLVSRVPVAERPGHEREHWIYVNGVAVGQHWLQKNVDLLSYTFGRRVTGVLNPTSGIIFDILQCLIQRDFSYATQDVRDEYVLIKKALLNPQYDKVVLILHSQGAIEGGLVIDWLLDELPQNLLHQLEVYTFGSAANHFNNPSQSQSTQQATLQNSNVEQQHRQSIGYIEHYANAVDFVSVWGVLHYINIPNRYMGRLFVRPGSGHLMNQHYMDNMFTLGPDRKVLDSNPFMDMEVDMQEGTAHVNTTSLKPGFASTPCDALLPNMSNGEPARETPRANRGSKVLRVKDFSRLWQYRNGGSPPDVNHN
ncbi:hypothetical protein N7474_004626 [Penicillium riverlandense]|uniref:uncharacterized protein n=1 Tax=Penicillium riverlandense TaxID=1903569 RepID=UPI0025492C8D|nr:uncharacterized protein N7474_004626 [Penicillium riverlandense]KAJ5819035.1 hypothetical protein N7474_004626 [Penicillium riverlandense]